MLSFDNELSRIGHIPNVVEKSRALTGRYDLAVNCLVVWDSMQAELRAEPGLGSVRSLMYDELKEVHEKEPLEIELARLRDKSVPWYQRKRALDYWSVANEMADVLVLLVADMKQSGMNDSDVFDALVGRAHHNDRALINELVARTATLGMDLAEIIVLKTEINIQHRDPSLLSWVRSDGFMKRIRRSIGNGDSQIPHLAQGLLGETVLTKLQSPKLVESSKIDLFHLQAQMDETISAVIHARLVGDGQGIFAVA